MEGFTSNQAGANSYVHHHLLLSPNDRHSDPDSDQSQAQTQPIRSGPPSPLHRPRGRPPGSKNKPKPPVVVTRDTPNCLRALVLDVSAGADIVESLHNYARQREKGVFVMGGRGMVSNVSIRQPSSGALTLQGPYEMLSLTGIVLPAPPPQGAGGLSIFLSGAQGEVLGGILAAPLIATERVVLVAASFANAVFERLPVDNQASEGNAAAGSGGGGGGQVQSAPSQSSGVTGGGGGGSTLPLFNVEANVAAPPPSAYAFSPDLSGWGGSNVAPRSPF